MTLISFTEKLEYPVIADVVRSNDSVVEAHAIITDSFNSWWEDEERRQYIIYATRKHFFTRLQRI